MVRAADHGDELAAIYDRWRLRTPGGLIRPRPMWDELLADREGGRRGASAWFAFLHPDGYALYRTHGGDPVTARVHELFAVTRDAHVALWRALCGLDLVERIVVETWPEDPLPYLFTDARLARTTAMGDHLWLRLMDVPAALEARGYAGDVSTVLDIGDGFRADGGRFALDVRDGRARCRPTDAPAQVSMDLDVLGSLYFGAHRASTIAASNRLRCNDSEVLHRLDEAFASDVPAQLGYGF
jgi:predicted acetyltransferase